MNFESPFNNQNEKEKNKEEELENLRLGPNLTRFRKLEIASGGAEQIEPKQEELPYFVDEKKYPETRQKLLDKQESIKDKDSIEFKEVELELINLFFKRNQAETYRQLFDKDLSKDEKDTQVETLRKHHLRNIIFEKELYFEKNEEKPTPFNSEGLELFLAKRELYSDSDYERDKIEQAIKGFSEVAQKNPDDSWKMASELDEYYFVNFCKEQYEDKLKYDIEERKKEGYVFMKNKDALDKGPSIGVKKLEDGRIDYSSAARMWTEAEKKEWEKNKEGKNKKGAFVGVEKLEDGSLDYSSAARMWTEEEKEEFEKSKNKPDDFSFEKKYNNLEDLNVFKNEIRQTIKDVKDKKIDLSREEKEKLILKQLFTEFKGRELTLIDDYDYFDAEDIKEEIKHIRKGEIEYLGKKFKYQEKHLNDDFAKLKKHLIGSLKYYGNLENSSINKDEAVQEEINKLIENGYKEEVDNIIKDLSYLNKDVYLKEKESECKKRFAKTA